MDDDINQKQISELSSYGETLYQARKSTSFTYFDVVADKEIFIKIHLYLWDSLHTIDNSKNKPKG